VLDILRRNFWKKDRLEQNPITILREELSHKLSQIFDYKVSYGVFKGMSIVPELTWNKADLGSMILGLYEKEVIQVLEENPRSTLINLGAGDGYYAIGGVVSGLFQKSIAFEMNSISRKVIREGLRLNNVSDKVQVFEIAEKNFWKLLQLPKEKSDDWLILSDIEGGEFELFDSSAFEFFRCSIVIIEIHDWVFEGPEKLKKLINFSEKTHEVEELTTSSRDLSTIPEVATFSDNERWLICSEGRPKLMKWLVFYPKKS
jgi:hypothetical protein